MSERWTRGVLRLRWVVLAAWIAVFLVSGALSSGLADLFHAQAGLPGTDSDRVDTILQDEFGQKSYAGFTVVVDASGGDVSSLLPVVEERARRAAQAVPTGQLVGVGQVAEGVLMATIASTLDVPEAKDHTAAVRAAVGSIDGATVYTTGNAALAADLAPVFEEDLKVGELFIALPIAILILAFVFGTLAFLLPLIFALAAIPATLAGVWVFAHWMPMEQTVQNLVTFIGLGIAIDYSLIIVYRYREEIRRDGDRNAAIARTMKTAGHAVVFSGTAVAIGLALLIAMPVPGLRGYGVAGLLVPLVSVATAITLMPVLLYFLERPLDRVRLVPRRVLERRESVRDEENGWMRFAHRVMRRPRVVAAGSLATLLLLASPVLALDLGPGTNEMLPAELESTKGLRVLDEAVGDGALNPTEIVIDTGRAGGADDPLLQSASATLVAQLNQDPEIALVQQETGSAWVDATRRYVRLQAIGRSDFGSPQAGAFVDRLRSELAPSVGFPDGARVLVGGVPAQGVDFIDQTYGAFPFLLLAVLALTYVLLLRAFRSLLLPLKAIVLNLLSIGAAYGLLVAAFKWGLGTPLGLIEYDQVTAWIPVFLFAMLFGLSMDYEVFLVSRMREEWDRTKDNGAAVAVGLAKTGRLVTAAGLIMFAAFMGLIVGSFVDLQQFGFGLAAAIIIDVTIVRALLLPSAMTLFGRWNWWLPASVARIARVEPSPLEGRAPEAPAAAPV